MSAADIANQHFTAALADAKAEGVDSDSLCRSLPQENRSRRLNTERLSCTVGFRGKRVMR